MTEHISIVGNVGTEPTVDKTDGGITRTWFRVACPQRVRDANTGEWRDRESNWYNVVAFGTLAENIIKSVNKGMRIVASGSLKVRRWERDGKTGTSVDLNADGLGPDLRWGKVTGYERTLAARRQDDAPNGGPWMRNAPADDSAGPSAEPPDAEPADEAAPEGEAVPTPF